MHRRKRKNFLFALPKKVEDLLPLTWLTDSEKCQKSGCTNFRFLVFLPSQGNDDNAQIRIGHNCACSSQEFCVVYIKTTAITTPYAVITVCGHATYAYLCTCGYDAWAASRAFITLSVCPEASNKSATSVYGQELFLQTPCHNTHPGLPW